MHFVGVDLAWGQRNPTGVAVVDDRGGLVHVSAAADRRRDPGRRAEARQGPCVVALDAPLVVTNPTGNRPGEAALNADFGRFDAGAHPSNTGKEEFRDGTRGGLLAEALGLDLDPASTADRRAIEVYPHAATVALFRLGRILKYKNRTGSQARDLLRSELLRLTELVETLEQADPPMHVNGNDAWKALVAQAETPSGRATSGSSRTRSTRWCAPTSRCSRGGAPSGSRRTATPRPARSSPRPCPPTSCRASGERVDRPGSRRRPCRTGPTWCDAAVADFAAGHADLRRRPRSTSALVQRAARRRRHQLPVRDRPGQERRVVRGQGPARGRRRCRRSPTR